MTLSSLKYRLKIVVIGILLIIYGVGFFIIGKHSKVNEIQKIKESSTNGQDQDSIERPQPYADSQTGQIISSYVKLCSNTFDGYEVAYPKDWFTTYNSESSKCSFFAPYSFIIPQVIENDFVPIKIEIIKIDQWQNSLKFSENPNDFQNIISVKNLEINGRSVEKVEAATTGKGVIPQGFVKTTYLIFDSTKPLVISYQQLEAKEDVTKNLDVLEEMVDSLRFF